MCHLTQSAALLQSLRFIGNLGSLHHTTKAVFIDFGNFYEAEIITKILGCAKAYPILIIILLQHLKCYLQS